MTQFKQYLPQFLTWLRNGFAFCTTWFLLLLLALGVLHGAETVTMQALVHLLLWCAGGSLLFCLIFTKLLLRSAGFTFRLTLFLLLAAGYQFLLPIYGPNPLRFLFGKQFPMQYGGTQWEYFVGANFNAIVFVGIMAVLFLACMVIYHFYSKKKGTLYTEALRRYQEEGENAAV